MKIKTTFILLVLGGFHSCFSQVDFVKFLSVESNTSVDFQIKDIDQDGDQDVVAMGTINGKLVWWKNDGAANFELKEIGNIGQGIFTISDLDADGDLDIIAAEGAFENKMKWWKNDGSGNFVPSEVEDFVRTMSAIKVVDIDQDNDLDILGMIRTDNEIAWWENVNQNFTKRTIATDISFGGDIEIFDLNGDGHLDIVASASGSDQLIILQNSGQQIFSKSVLDEGTELNGVQEIVINDLNGDGFLDISCATTSNNTILVYLNQTNSGAFIREVLVDSILNPNDFDYGDFDLDGDDDIIVAEIGFAGPFVWYENIGNLVFEKREIIDNVSAARRLSIGDLDNDNDLDFVGLGRNDNSVNELTFWTNTFCQLDSTSSSIMICQGDTISWNNLVIFEEGIYASSLTDILGCRYIETLIVSVEFESGIGIEILNDISLTVNAPSNFSIEWMDCNTGNFIPGAFATDFTPTYSGEFAAQVTSPSGCVTITNCLEIIITSLKEPNNNEDFIISPNPTKGWIKLAFEKSTTIEEVEILHLNGSAIAFDIKPSKHLDLSFLLPGIYIVKVKTDSGSYVQKLTRI